MEVSRAPALVCCVVLASLQRPASAGVLAAFLPGTDAVLEPGDAAGVSLATYSPEAGVADTAQLQATPTGNIVQDNTLRRTGWPATFLLDTATVAGRYDALEVTDGLTSLTYGRGGGVLETVQPETSSLGNVLQDDEQGDTPGTTGGLSTLATYWLGGGVLETTQPETTSLGNVLQDDEQGDTPGTTGRLTTPATYWLGGGVLETAQPETTSLGKVLQDDEQGDTPGITGGPTSPATYWLGGGVLESVQAETTSVGNAMQDDELPHTLAMTPEAPVQGRSIARPVTEETRAPLTIVHCDNNFECAVQETAPDTVMEVKSVVESIMVAATTTERVTHYKKFTSPFNITVRDEDIVGTMTDGLPETTVLEDEDAVGTTAEAALPALTPAPAGSRGSETSEVSTRVWGTEDADAGGAVEDGAATLFEKDDTWGRRVPYRVKREEEELRGDILVTTEKTEMTALGPASHSGMPFTVANVDVPSSSAAGYLELREAKVLNFFPIPVSEECVSDDNRRYGTCLNTYECRILEGESHGPCALGFGVCCVFAVSCDREVSNNVTYFLSPKFPELTKDVTECSIQVKKMAPEISQLRFDFIHFNLGQPNRRTGVCDSDAMVVSGGSSKDLRICGQNSGHHVYYDVENTNDSISVMMNLTKLNVFRLWEIKVTQVEFNQRAPAGCLQYYQRPSGTIQTLNFADNGRHLADQDYLICMRQEENMCSIVYEPCDENSFKIGPGPSAALVADEGSGYGASDDTSRDCVDKIVMPCDSEDFIMPKDSGGSSVCDLLHCGSSFCTAGENPCRVESSTLPFHIQVQFGPGDRDESPEDNLGMCLRYEQQPCAP